MKKILTIFVLLLYTFISKAQTYPITQNLGSPSTLVKNPNYGGFQGGLIPYSFTDTSSANSLATFLSNYNGAIIWTTTPPAVWYRAASLNKWVQLIPGADTSSVAAWSTRLNTNIPTDASLVGFFGTTASNGVGFYTNNTQRFILPAGGLNFNQVIGDTTLNKVLTYNTSTKELGYGYWYGSGGSGSTPTWENTLDVAGGSVLTHSNTVTGTEPFTLITNFGGSSSQMVVDAGVSYFLSANTALNTSASIEVKFDSIFIRPPIGRLYIDTLTNVAARYILHYDPTTGLVSYADTTAAGGSGWLLTGNAGTTAGTNFLGTTDGVDLVIKTNGTERARFYSTGGINIPNTSAASLGVIFKNGTRFIHNFQLAGTSGDNTFFGTSAGNFTMTGSSGLQGSYNLGVGASALSANTQGYKNTALGTYALQNNTTGLNNNATGQAALFTNTTGYNNVANGVRAIAFGTNGHDNVGVGVDAISRNNTGIYNVGVGTDALYNNYNGQYNVAIGDSTLWKDSTGFKNTAIGSRAGYYLGDTYSNFSTQHDSLVTFIGADASRDSSISNQTAINNSTAIGYNAKVYASNQVSIGNSNTTSTLLRGNVGINNTSPSVALDVVGDMFLKTSSYPSGLLSISNSGQWYIGDLNGDGNRTSIIGDDATQTAIYQANNGHEFIGGVTFDNGIIAAGLTSQNNADDSMLVRKASDGTVGYQTLVNATSTTTFSNKRWVARVGSTTSSATPTINTDNYDVYKLTAQAAAITSFTTNLSGTPNDGDILEIQITDDGTARAITWGSSFVSSTVTLPTTTTISTTLTVIFQYYTTSSYGNNKWVCTNYY